MSAIDDGAYFDQVLSELASEHARRTGEDTTAFADLVRRRIRHGALLYGERAYLDRDNLPEARDEAADLVAYPLFELRRLTLGTAEIPGEVPQLLFDAMCAAALADLKVRQARRLLQRR